MVIYYQNEIRVKRGLLTIFINRFGDGAIIFYMCIFFLFERSVFLTGDFSSLEFYLGIFLFFLACFSKRAQFPFISWLPAAMTAPTPVSSLVHSSTLVTAGIYLIIRFNIFLFDRICFFFISSLGLLTIGVGGFLAIIEIDFKKIVAFSTLRQLGLLIFILSFGEVKMCFFHLLSHAIFKSFLFIMCGVFISFRYGNQDNRLIGVKFVRGGLFQIIILFSCLNLRGFPLTIGFLSRDLILETFSQGIIRSFFLLMFIIFCCFTVCYRIKLFFSIIFFIKFGLPLVKREFFLGGKLWLILLFMFIFSWGLGLEEFLVDDDLFSLSQDYKILDLLIFLIGFYIFLKRKHFVKFGYIVSDYF